MDIYWEFVKKSFSQKFMYRADSYIQIFGTLVKLFILMSAWTALYQGKTEINGITLADMISFVTINIVVSALTNSRVAEKIAVKVNDGSIAVDFVKPISFRFFMLADELGENLYRAVFNTIPACLFATLLWGFRLPADPVRLGVFLLSLINGIVLVMYLNYVFGLLAFWFKTAFHINWFMGALYELFSGTFVPLWFYPKILFNISVFLPFRYISFEPISIFLEKISLMDSLKVIVWQLIWILILAGLDNFIWGKAQSKVTVHGG